ncbi:MAG: DUF1684 domain-containing protein [Acidobacteriota bacterium]
MERGVLIGCVWLTGTLLTLPSLGQRQATAPDDLQAYFAEIEAERRAADEELRDDHWSPLAVIAMLRLSSEPVTIGSAPTNDLVLEGETVAPRHAEVGPETIGGKTRYRIHALDGNLFAESGSRAPISELLLEKGGERLQLDRFTVYYDEIATLGPILRVLDFSSPAYTRFDGLRYFPVDPSYRVEAELHPYPAPEQIKIIDTMGFLSPGWVYGEAEFTLMGHPLRLKLVLFTPEPQPDSSFYVIFSDETNAKETYGACRYLLPKFVRSGKIVLDFNRSVNPSCAYNNGFACPLPPPGNRIPFSVRSGIKDYANGPRH